MARPREFDEDDVLQKAMFVFWEKGYEGTSLSDLLADMKMTKSSLYTAFGSKEQLFARVTERYHRDHLAFRLDALAQPTPRRMVEALLNGMAELQSGIETPAGCLEINAALACSAEAEPIRRKLAGNREGFRIQLRDRFDATLEAGPMPVGMNSDDAASLVFAIVQGMAVQAKGGFSRQNLRRVVHAALLAWPEDAFANPNTRTERPLAT
jgi:AcrR family transcriptional regulator